MMGVHTDVSRCVCVCVCARLHSANTVSPDKALACDMHIYSNT